MANLSYLNSVSPLYIEELYELYKQNPKSVDVGWQKFFEGFDFGSKTWIKNDLESVSDQTYGNKELNVYELIQGYRNNGHLFAKTNPVRERREHFPKNDLASFGLSTSDELDYFEVGDLVGLGKTTLQDIKQLLEDTYCRSIGVEYTYIRDIKSKQWLQNTMESSRNSSVFSTEFNKRILSKLYEASSFEEFLGTKFVGQKRFSLEGAEGLIPALDYLLTIGANLGVKEVVFGMAHRGRLNVLTHILGKSYSKIFDEFVGGNDTINHTKGYNGDVKYHLGYQNEINTIDNHQVKVTLLPNPSHLETVSPVVEGYTRAEIDENYSGDSLPIIPVLIHGDAAFANQGVIYEILQMSGVKGYSVGGTIHIIVNNQIGFTTNYEDSRTSTYCTDIAKLTLSPVFHVNGDDVEAVLHTVKLAVEYRQNFHSDVFIDILCYRKHGHNEGDEPKFTQPSLYELIGKHTNAYELYKRELITKQIINLEEIHEIESKVKHQLNNEYQQSSDHFSLIQENSVNKNAQQDNLQGVFAFDEQEFIDLAKQISTLPTNYKFFRKTVRLYQERLKNVESGIFTWAMAELMAYATLLNQGFRVRISGQDVERGTFSHRHAIITIDNKEQENEYVPLQCIKGGDKFSIYNSTLSEYGVLGYEYGYALANANSLTIWEAQFGDFLNGAQIVVDQYITSAKTKWNISNGLVLLLPHGYEGQGPEHSSARIERMLELCADQNIQVVNCTTPANYYHILRGQMLTTPRKPLIVFTPKSLLRHPKVISTTLDFVHSSFKSIINDDYASSSLTQKILLCSGKIYYDLLEKQQELKNDRIAIIRIEQLYPFPERELKVLVDSYANVKEIFWVQEEPENMGAWPYISRKQKQLLLDIKVISRKESSSTATGFSKQHMSEQIQIINQSFN
ncbi:2-oxoglutarate dehydrogenase E1 component [Myroides odoratimimus]|uniref:2-oxoglutarate dehydrogenase E1 component n=1 Tax=Myroides odoratimimus TaxID=76832 RepID=UPI003100FD9A